MFQSLRIGTPLYVFYKNEPRLEIGEVAFVSQPVNQFNQPVYGSNQPANVDIQVTLGKDTLNLKGLPATFTVADCGNGMVVSESREAISTEISIMRTNSQKVLDSIEQHKDIVRKCNELLQEINPQIKQDAERAKEIEELAQRVGGLENSISDIKGLLVQTLKDKK